MSVLEIDFHGAAVADLKHWVFQRKLLQLFIDLQEFGRPMGYGALQEFPLGLDDPKMRCYKIRIGDDSPVGSDC